MIAVTWEWRPHAVDYEINTQSRGMDTNAQYISACVITVCTHTPRHTHVHIYKIQVRFKTLCMQTEKEEKKNSVCTYFCLSRDSRVLLLRFCRLEGGTECTEELFLLEEWEEWDEWDKLVRDCPALWSNCMRQKIRSVGTSSNSYGGFVITYLSRTQIEGGLSLNTYYTYIYYWKDSKNTVIL